MPMPHRVRARRARRLARHVITELHRVRAWREFNTLLRFWRACPTRRCRRWRRCAGDPARCHAIFWPVVPEEAKVWWRTRIAAVLDGSTEPEAIVRADDHLRRWRAWGARELHSAKAGERRSVGTAKPGFPAKH